MAAGLALSLAACDDGGGSVGSTDATLMGSVEGLDTGSGISGATVRVNGREVQANESGWFIVPGLEAEERVLVELEAPGMIPTQRVIALREGRQTFLDARMVSMAPAQAIDPAVGGEVTGSGGATLSIPAGAIRTPSGGTPDGMAQVSVTALDPTSREARLAAPGDFTGVPAGSDEPENIESFGMAFVSVRDQDGNELTFDPAMGAELSIPVPSGFAGTPPTEMPLWRYDEGIGRWVDEGAVAYDDVSGTYVSDIDEPAYWNADQTYATACVSGTVVSPEGETAPGGIKVAAEGVSYVGEAVTYTDADGRFQVQVMASTDGGPTAAAQLYAQGGGLYTPSPLVVDPTPTTLASEGSCIDVGTLELAFPIGTIALTWDRIPDDLDTHFTGPDADAGGRFHLYYSNEDVGQAFLDTDDTSSFGPEVTSLLDDEPGVYVYSVHNYSGETDGPILESGAIVHAVFPGETRSFQVAEATGSSSGEDAVWRVFRFEIRSDGTIGRIQPIQQIVTGDTIESYDP